MLRMLCFLGIIFTLSNCSKDSNNAVGSSANLSGRYVGVVILSTVDGSQPYNMVVDFSNRSSTELNFLYANRNSVAILSSSVFTIPEVRSNQYLVSGNGQFLDSNKVYIDYTEKLDGGFYQNFKGTLEKF